jgi:hypothetical protein
MRSKLTALAFAAVLSAASVSLAHARDQHSPSQRGGFAQHVGLLGALGLVGLLARRKPATFRRAL